MFFTGISSLRAEVVSAGGRRPGRRIFIASSQADGRRSGYRLWRQTAVATEPPFMRRLFGAACFLCDVKHSAAQKFHKFNSSVAFKILYRHRV